MSRTGKLTLSAMIAALCVAILYLTALIPRVTLAITALAGVFPAAVVIACGYGWAAGTVVTASILSLLLLPDKTAGLWFVFFFGHYPLWKLLIERVQTRMGKPVVGWAMKLLGVGICLEMLFILFRSSFLRGIPAAFLSDAGLIATILVIAVCFVVYDIAFSILIGYFRIRILPRIK